MVSVSTKIEIGLPRFTVQKLSYGEVPKFNMTTRDTDHTAFARNLSLSSIV